VKGRSRLADRVRTAFWAIPAVAMALGVAAGILLPQIDEALKQTTFSVLGFGGNAEGARGMLSTIAGATVSVAGLAFSVTVVALTLASSQLSPRVLRTFRERRLYQVTLAVFLGTFVYALLVLRTVRADPVFVPEVSIGLAIVLAVAAFGLFVAFIGDLVVSVQASTVIRRIASDSHGAIGERFPDGVGEEPGEGAGVSAWERARQRSASAAARVYAPRAGFVVRVDGMRILTSACRADALVRQRAGVGDFVLTGGVLAEVHAADATRREELAGELADAFGLAEERTVEQDIAFSVRQLADVALKGLSPSINDPTTAENAMGSLADMLVRIVRAPQPSSLRLDTTGEPRLVTLVPDVDDLVHLGFDQVRRNALDDATVAVRLLELLAEIESATHAEGHSCEETARQAAYIRSGARSASQKGDAERVCQSYERLFGGAAVTGATDGQPASA